jgi:hypothetical protein
MKQYPLSLPFRPILLTLCAFVLLFGISRSRASTPALSIFILSGTDGSEDGNRSDAAVVQSLRGQGYSVQLGPTPDQWDGTQADLSEYDAVVLLNSYNGYMRGFRTMPIAGQLSLKQFVSLGGGLVTGEWICQQASWLYDESGDPDIDPEPLYPELYPILPADGDLIPDERETRAVYHRWFLNPVVQDGLQELVEFPRSPASDGCESTSGHAGRSGVDP